MLSNSSTLAHPLTGRARLWLIITGAVILTTLLVGYTVTDAPRSLMTWVVLVFICFIEFAAGMMAAEASATDSSQSMSSAMASVVLGSAGLFGVVGFATLLALLGLTKSSASRDAIVISVLVVETVVFLIGMVLLRHADRSIQAGEQTSMEANRSLADKSARIREVAYSLRSLRTANVEQSIQIESLVKGLETCALQCCHAHNSPAEFDDSLSAATSALEAAGAAAAKDGLNQTSLPRLTEIEKELHRLARRLAAG